MNIQLNGSHSRRSFLGLAALGMASRSIASTTCGIQSCVSQVDFDDFAQSAFQDQEMPEWCWAACISMLFSFYDHPVSQERIVSEVYGAPVNMPAGYGGVIASQLNRAWTDDNGDRFRARLTAAYDADAGFNNLDNLKLLNELDGDHPVIIGAGSHAMVLTMMQFVRTQMGPYVQRCGVFDPWPGRGARDLTASEMVPMFRGGSLRFAATARIQDL